jgi:uncharacterized peroxidase-related enzyme
MAFPIHTVESAPASARDFLAGTQKALGFVPNLLGVMASAPALAKAYGAMIQLFDQTSFSPTERQVVLLATSVENGCEYCVAAHSVIAGIQKVPAEVVEALRTGAAIADPKLEVLRRFTAAMVSKRGWPAPADVQAFLAAGYTEVQMLEVVLGIGFKTLSNYTTHITGLPVDDAFAPAAWNKVA